MDKIGTVLELKNEYAVVEIGRANSCGEKCSSCKSGCTPTGIKVTARNEVKADVGQIVILEMEKKRVLKAAFLIYILPLIGLIIGIIVGMWAGVKFEFEPYEELVGIVFGLFLLTMVYLGISRFDKIAKQDASYDVIIKEKIL
ncbi:SoxR reducing system RseC family protein [Alkaliphilus peptidifermentans]|uniref:Positive regulator of sigma(E), RseC/MucC n=1 Tax=Alkaliphilus peptidifermentans DSM 18978 TaxID=1120976 RepID=A0A1G5DPL7_9FIRM|nr:SoxR reducing system RseC family protein [Alkaliphilus peptidifermentans]SCY16656.1 positive regulator of sigma(E), RseC/MucC [Alkaliphilus peptidifermentans DSM 18978]